MCSIINYFFSLYVCQSGVKNRYQFPRCCRCYPKNRSSFSSAANHVLSGSCHQFPIHNIGFADFFLERNNNILFRGVSNYIRYNHPASATINHVSYRGFWGIQAYSKKLDEFNNFLIEASQPFSKHRSPFYSYVTLTNLLQNSSYLISEILKSDFSISSKILLLCRKIKFFKPGFPSK